MTQIARISQLAAYDDFFAEEMAKLQLQATTSFITGLSGGPDSTALACLTSRYAQSRGATHKAIIVNHNIRIDSAREAEQVKQRMQEQSISSQIVNINEKAPSTGIQEWARHSRFSALTKQARYSESVLLLAHHKSDQAETVLMRLARGSGIGGLAAIRPKTEYAAVSVARPLLGWSVEALQDVLRLLDCDYEKDPSNQNSNYERVRVRALIRDGAAFGYPTISNALRLSRAMAAITEYVDEASAPIWQEAISVRPSGYAVIDMGKLEDLPEPMWQQNIRRLIRQIGGRRYGASGDALKRLRKKLIFEENSTLGGCQFIRSKQAGQVSRYFVVRELGRHSSELSVRAGDDVIFAGCWRVRSGEAGQLLSVGRTQGQPDIATTLSPPRAIAALPYLVRRVIPVLRTLDGALVYPQISGIEPCNTSQPSWLSARFLGW